jgi:hypothetical protein
VKRGSEFEGDVWKMLHAISCKDGSMNDDPLTIYIQSSEKVQKAAKNNLYFRELLRFLGVTNPDSWIDKLARSNRRNKCLVSENEGPGAQICELLSSPI